MPARIRAALCRGFGQPLSLEAVDLRDPREGEVEVTLEAVAICHSDVSFIDGAWGGRLPAVYGHEAAGIVTGLGAGVRAVALGQRVIVTLIRSCGHCPNCASGAPVYCATPDWNDSPLSTAAGPVVKAMDTGAFAERVVVDASQLAAVEADMPADLACLLACGVITGIGAVVNTARVRPGQNVVVVGAGGVGLNAIQGARISGAARIIAIDVSEAKLADARTFGATDGVLADAEKPWQDVARITEGRLADAVFVTVGAVAAYDAAPRYLAPGGAVYMVGMPHSGDLSRFEPVILAALGQGMRGTKMGDTVIARDIPWMIDLWRQGRLDLAGLVSRRWRFDQINEAIADTRAGSARRNVIVMDPADGPARA